MATKTDRKPVCTMDGQPAVARLSYQFPGHVMRTARGFWKPRQSHYFVCAEHDREFGREHLVREVRY